MRDSAGRNSLLFVPRAADRKRKKVRGIAAAEVTIVREDDRLGSEGRASEEEA